MGTRTETTVQRSEAINLSLGIEPRQSLQQQVAGVRPDIATARSLRSELQSIVQDERRRSAASSNVGLGGLTDKASSGIVTSSHSRSVSVESSSTLADSAWAPAASQNPALEQPKTGWWANIKSLVTGVAKGAVELGRLVVVEGLPKLVSKEFWSGVGSALAWVGDKLTDPATWKAGWELTWKVVTMGPRALAYAITHPVEAAKKVGSFLKGMSDGLGITDICVGVGRLCKGDLGGAVQAFKGAGTAFLEFTGIADAWGTIKHTGLALIALGKGDKIGFALHMGQAVMHGTMAAMSWASIAATVATGGAAAGAIVGVMMLRQSAKSAAKQVLKTAAKEFLESAGKELGEKVVKDFAKHVGPEVLQKAGVDLADKGMKDVLRETLGEKGFAQLLSPLTSKEARNALIEEASQKMSSDAFHTVFKKQSAEAVEGLLKKGKLTELVDKHALELLKGVDKKNAKQLAQELVESGLIKDKSHALRMAKDMKKALSNDFLGYSPYVESGKSLDEAQKIFKDWRKGAAAKRANADDMMKNILQEGVTKEVRDHLEKGMKESFMAQMQKGLTGQLDTPTSKALGEILQTQSKRLGKDVDTLVKEYSDSAWKGTREAIEESVRKSVREGLDSAFKKFRDLEMRPISHQVFSALFRREGIGAARVFEKVDEDDTKEKKGKGETEVEVPKARLEFDQKTYFRGGKMVKETMVRHEGGRWQLAGREEFGLADFAEEVAAAKIAEASKRVFGGSGASPESKRNAA